MTTYYFNKSGRATYGYTPKIEQISPQQYEGDTIVLSGSGVHARVIAIHTGSVGQALVVQPTAPGGVTWGAGGGGSALGDVDGGAPTSVYGGIDPIDCGGV